MVNTKKASSKTPNETPDNSAPHGSIVVVIVAIVANTIIAIIKFFAAFFTGSSAMMAEGIHSLVDIGNGVLVGYGIKQSSKPADRNHPFGHGSEIYFWSLIVAISIFGIGGGMSIFEGIQHITHPGIIENPFISYIVLGISIVVEGTSLLIAIRQFNAAKGSKSPYSFIKATKDPSLFTVLFEDTAAVIGLFVAFLGISLSVLTGNYFFDGLASICIGVLLMCVALLLARESKGLLIGEGVEAMTAMQMRQIISSNENVDRIGQLKTLYLGPDNLLLNVDIKFADGINAELINSEIDSIEAELVKQFPEVKNIFIEVASDSDVTAGQTAEALFD